MGLLVIWLIFGVAAAIIASNRGASGFLWLCLGIALGPIGLLLSLTTGVKCPKCASRISKDAEVCPRCQHRLIKPGTPAWNPKQIVVTESCERCQRCGAVSDRTVFKEACPMCGEKFIAPNKPTKACPYCAETILAEAKKCRYCGEFLDAPVSRKCPNCGSSVAEDAKVCPSCRHMISNNAS